jgi:hypothetical protein
MGVQQAKHWQEQAMMTAINAIHLRALRVRHMS